MKVSTTSCAVGNSQCMAAAFPTNFLPQSHVIDTHDPFPLNIIEPFSLWHGRLSEKSKCDIENERCQTFGKGSNDFFHNQLFFEGT